MATEHSEKPRKPGKVFARAAQGIENPSVALAAREQQLRAIVENSPECIKIVASDGTLLEMNPAGQRMVGAASEEEIIGKSVYSLIAPEDRERFIAMNQRVCQGEAQTLLYQIIDLRGRRHFMETHAVPLENPAQRAINQLAVTRDVTDRVREANASRFLAAVVESSDDAIITKNLDGFITSWNESASRLFGYSAEEAIGRHITILIPEDRWDEEPAILARLRKGERVDHFETIRRRKDGTLLDISLTISPVRNSAGEIIGASKVARDITEMKRARQELKRSHEELEKRVDERTSSLREALSQLEEFSYSVSHDLRAPIRAMQGYAHAILEDFGPQLDPLAQDYLRRIVAGSSRMQQLIHDVLAYSRLARTDLPLGPISIEFLLNEIIQQYPEMQLPRAEICLRKPFLAVRGHGPSLSQAISNLLSNAIKFVPPGKPPRVELWTERRGSMVRLWVKDNGIGIEPRHQHLLFAVFQRAHNDAAYEGTGIGLAIVRKAAEKMGGRTGVESDGVNGSSFWMELPAA